MNAPTIKPGYECQCHVCGAVHTVEAGFLSSALSLLGKDGKARPAYVCPGKHTREEVQAAWRSRCGEAGMRVAGRRIPLTGNAEEGPASRPSAAYHESKAGAR